MSLRWKTTCTDKTENSSETGTMEDKILHGQKNKTELVNKAAKGRTYRRIGMKYFDQGNFQKAIEYHHLHLSIAKEIGDSAGEGSAYANLGIAYSSLGDFKKAIEYHQLHLVIVKALGDKIGEGGAYTNLGIAYRNLGHFKTAIEYHQLHLDILVEKRNRAGEGIAYANLGIAYDSLGDFKKAVEYHQLHLEISKEVGDKAGEGMAYTNLGIAYHNLGDFETALECQMSHLPIAKEVGNRVGEGCVYANLGKTYHSLGDFKKAIEYHQLHLSITKQVGDRAGEGRAYGNLGHAYHDLGNIRKALEYYHLDLSIAKEVQDRAGEGSAYGNLGHVLYSLGNFKKAVGYHQLHLQIATELGARSEEGHAYSNLGIAYFSLGDFKKAIDYIQEYLTIAKDLGDRAGEGRGYGNIGSAYASLGEFKKAIHFHKLHLKIAQETGDVAGEGGAYGNLGTVHLNSGDFEKAKEYHDLELTIAKKVGNRSSEARAYSNLGIHHHSLGKKYVDESHFKIAIEYHQLHLRIAKEVGARSEEGSANANLGAAYDALGDYEKAIEHHQQFLSISKELEDIVGEGVAYCNLGNAYGSLGDLSKAEDFFNSSVNILDNLRGTLSSRDDLQISLRDYYKGPYTALWMVLLKQNKISEAFLTAERGRGQALKDLMESRYGLRSAHHDSCEEMEEIANLSYISSQTVFLAIDKTAINFWVLRNNKECHFLRKEIAKKYLKEDAIVTFKALNDDLYSKIGVLETVQCENRASDVPVDETQISDKTESLPANYDNDPLKLFYDLIISPIADLIPSSDVIIVPDGPLFLAPFAAFVDQNSRYLSEKHTIRLVPTLTTLKIMAELSERHQSANGVLLVGDPWMGSIRIKGKAPNQLPNARIEVEMIGKILKTVPLTNKAATKAEVLSRLSSVALVHIATHGKAETGEILLSPNPAPYKRPKEKDYLLTMEDVKNAKLKARLVVLSCCHTGRGDIKAEGVVGIARAFLGAGARSVLASLWAIDDAATLTFMEYFYKQLVEGRQRASKSLNQAMKLMRESENYNEVRLWAPFILIGDDVSLDLGQTLTPESQPSVGHSST